MPRPKRPDRVHSEVIDPDDYMADCANLDLTDYRHRIKRRATHLIDDFVASWERRATRGRKPEAKRDALINALARLFHEQSGWESRYGDKEYRVGLRAFLVCILAANGIDAPPDRLVRLRVIEPTVRKPRA